MPWRYSQIKGNTQQIFAFQDTFAVWAAAPISSTCRGIAVSFQGNMLTLRGLQFPP